MRADELRAISLFGGLADDQLAELAEGGTEVRIEPGVDLFHEGEHADFWWVLIDGAIDLVRRVGREDVVVARMDAPGRWAGGFRAWDENGVYLATGRGAMPGGACCVWTHCGPRAELVDHWFPLAGHLMGGLHRTARSIESTVRQRDALVTLGTLAAGLAHEINNPAAAASRTVDDLGSRCGTHCSSRWAGRLAHDDITAAQFAALDGLRREVVAPAARALDALALADREDGREPSGWRRITSPDAWGLAAPLVAGGIDLVWCERAPTRPSATTALAPGLSWVSATVCVAKVCCSELKDAVRSASPSWWPRSGPTPSWIGRPRSASTSVTAWRAP